LAHGATIKPGQHLVLPAGAAGKPVAEPSTATRAPLARAPTQPLPATAPVPTAGWEGHHTLKAGESLYAIARQHGVPLAELQRVNGITEPTRVRAGTVLWVPGSAAAAAAAAPPTAPASAGEPRLLNTPVTEQKTAALTDRSSDATEVAVEPSSPTGRLLWPAHGRVIAAFGKRPDGNHNVSTNISPPQATELSATPTRHVTYARHRLTGH